MAIHEVKDLFPDYLRYLWKYVEEEKENLQEIRMRAEKPILILLHNQEFFIHPKGFLTKKKEEGYIVTVADIEHTINYLCQYSIYAFEEEMKQGYFTIQGGHRIGIAGRMILEQGNIKNMQYISSANIRLAHEIKGVADGILPYIYHHHMLLNTMIISSPGAGKTTLLRDLIRQISDGNEYAEGRTVGVVDERSEIGGCYRGIPQNDIGIRTDVLDACPKIYGMMMLIRAMSPRVVAIDEIGNNEDVMALKQVLQCGCKLLVTVHGNDLQEVWRKPWYKDILEEELFQRFIVLKKQKHVGEVMGIYNEKGICL